MENQGLARKPPLHPGPRWWTDRRLLSDQLRSKARFIGSFSKGFVRLVKFDCKLEMEEWSYDFELVLDMAQLVLTKFHSTPPDKRHEDPSSLIPKDIHAPFYFTKIMGKVFAEQVQCACACACKDIKDTWWPSDFTDDLIQLVKNKLQKTLDVVDQ